MLYKEKLMLAAVVPGLFSPAGLSQNTTGGVGTGAVQHSGVRLLLEA